MSRCNTSSCNSSSLSLPALAPYTARGTLGSGKSLLNHVSNKIFGTLYLEQEAEEPQDDDGTWAARKDIQAKLQLFIVCRLGMLLACNHCQQVLPRKICFTDTPLDCKWKHLIADLVLLLQDISSRTFLPHTFLCFFHLSCLCTHFSETISREDQNILRTASIIGCNFSQVILYGILSPKMRTQMFSSLQSLVRSQWLLEKVSLIAGDSTDYSFVHPFFYRALYDLTPAGDKAILHYAVATFIEEAHYHSPVHFAQLGRHFGLAKDCRPKALEYYVRAASHSFNFGPLACDEGLGLLSQARMYADSALDYGTLLGLVIYRTQRLKSAMEILALRPPHNPLHSSTIPSSNWSFLNIRTSSRSNRVASLPVTTKLTEQEVEAASADRFLLLLAKMEVDLERLYGEMVRRNCVGVVSEWQRPYLVRWKAATELDISAPIVRPLHDQFEKSKDGLSSFRSWMSQLTVGPSRVDIDPDNSVRLSNPAVYGESGFSSDGDTPLEVSSSYTPLADIRPISDRPATVYSRSI